ncbi:hypothetical protein ACJX0J_001926 (mitochondrion) [Zea mays]
MESEEGIALYTRTAATLISFLFAQGATRKVGLGQGKNALYLFQYRLERNAKQRNEQTSDTLEGLPGMREQFIEALLLHGYTTLNPSLFLDNANISQHSPIVVLYVFSHEGYLYIYHSILNKQSEQGATVPVVENWRSCIGNWPYNSTIGKEAFRTSIHNNKEESRSNWKFPITFFFYLWLIIDFEGPSRLHTKSSKDENRTLNRLFDLYDRKLSLKLELRGCMQIYTYRHINRIKMFIITEGHIIVESFSCCCYFLVGKFR